MTTKEFMKLRVGDQFTTRGGKVRKIGTVGEDPCGRWVQLLAYRFTRWYVDESYVISDWKLLNYGSIAPNGSRAVRGVNNE